MCTIRLLALGALFCGLTGCAGQESTYADSDNKEATGGAGGDTASDGSSTRKPTGGELSASGGSSQSGSTTAESEPLCIPGASDECACPGGAKGAQICAKDGQSYGVCACEPEVVTEVVTEVKTVNPEGYSGECVRLGVSSAVVGGPCWSSQLILYVNCQTLPKQTGCEKANPGINLTGVYCCDS
jgi:hypothetical protein